MAELLGAERYHDYLAAFGFGRPSGVDFPGEAEGLFRHPWEDGWSPVDLATQSFGQSIGVTPLQMAAAVGAAINGGNLMRPHFLRAVVNDDGTETLANPVVAGHPVSPGTSETIRGMMQYVIEWPEWPHPAELADYTAGGKSGTANVPVPNGYDDTVTASFVGFAPAENPQVLILVKLDRNADLMTGTQAAGPVFAELANAVLHYLGIQPDKAGYGDTPPETISETGE
jgi:cell division protein FtsI/penicillin-binding protein 2